MEGKRISVVVPKKEVVRIQKITKSGPRMTEKDCWLIDFRGIRSTNCVNRNKKKQKYRGQKVAFNSPEKLQKEVDSYFDSCFGFMYDKYGNIKYDKNGEPIKYQNKPFTVSGLALAVGVTTSTLHRYCKGQFDAGMFGDNDLGEYKKILVKARQRIENYAETRLYDRDGNAGARFVLDSSFGWMSQKEASEIQERQFNIWLREQEFELKQKMLQMGQEDDSLEIRIVRKGE